MSNTNSNMSTMEAVIGRAVHGVEEIAVEPLVSEGPAPHRGLAAAVDRRISASSAGRQIESVAGFAPVTDRGRRSSLAMAVDRQIEAMNAGLASESTGAIAPTSGSGKKSRLAAAVDRRVDSARR